MNLEIRPATESEHDILLEFEKGIIATERPFDPTLKPGEIHYYDLIELIRSPDAEVLVAVINNEIVGSGYVKLVAAESYQSFETYAHLGFMFVKPAFRGKGINNLLINELIRWSQGRGIKEVRLEVYQENNAALNAYVKLGFQPNLLKMRLGI